MTQQTDTLEPHPPQHSFRLTLLLGALGGGLLALGWLPTGLAAIYPFLLLPLLLGFRRVETSRQAILFGSVFGAARFAVGAHFVLALIRFSGLAAVFYLLAILYILPFAIFECWTSLFLERKTGFPRTVSLALLIPLTEKLRTLGDLGFPADLHVHGMGLVPAWLSIARWTGPFGISILIFLCAALLAHGWSAWPDRRRAAAWIGAGAALWCLPALIALLLPGQPSGPRCTFRVGIVQPNVTLDDKKFPDRWPAMMERMETLTAEAARGTDLVLWPETARPAFVPLRNGKAEDREMGELARKIGKPILYGANIAEIEGTEVVALYNGAVLINPDGKVADWYGKQKLLPFAEAFPFANLFGMTPRERAKSSDHSGHLSMMGNYTPGPRPTLFKVGPARIGVLICYEGLFPNLSRQFSLSGANVLAVITNDFWWGHSVFPTWHSQLITTRAREVDLPILRAANNGISGIADRSGPFAGLTALDEVRSVTLAVELEDSAPTFYARTGDWPLGLALVVLCGAAIRGWVRRRPGGAPFSPPPPAAPLDPDRS